VEKEAIAYLGEVAKVYLGGLLQIHRELLAVLMEVVEAGLELQTASQADLEAVLAQQV
jgi:hypothetical protein